VPSAQIHPEAKTLEYAGICIQALQVGGDYFDFLDVGQQRPGLVIGDVSGKGIAAALANGKLAEPICLGVGSS
jgi:serine phosphatase RsbU (regulator of sigma subunit)